MKVQAGRYTANHPDDFVVLLIGLRINKIRKFREWMPVFREAFSMTKEALTLPGQPLLGSYPVWKMDDRRVLFFVQHWRSFDALMEWSNDKTLLHRPGMQGFMRRTAYNGNVGVWHETYKVATGQFEAIYANMPAMSLAAAGEFVPLSKKSRVDDRMGEPAAH